MESIDIPFRVTIPKSVSLNDRFLRLNKKGCHISTTKTPSLAFAISYLSEIIGEIDHTISVSQLYADLKEKFARLFR